VTRVMAASAQDYTAFVVAFTGLITTIGIAIAGVITALRAKSNTQKVATDVVRVADHTPGVDPVTLHSAEISNGAGPPPAG
jgi:hypothetical protein